MRRWLLDTFMVLLLIYGLTLQHKVMEAVGKLAFILSGGCQ